MSDLDRLTEILLDLPQRDMLPEIAAGLRLDVAKRIIADGWYRPSPEHHDGQSEFGAFVREAEIEAFHKGVGAQIYLDKQSRIWSLSDTSDPRPKLNDKGYER